MPADSAPDAPFEDNWLDAFIELFSLCRATADETIILLAETQSRQVNVTLARRALDSMNLAYQTITVPSKATTSGPIIRSTGASTALTGETATVQSLCQSHLVIDLTVEGLMHAPETAGILKAGARIMTISNEHPEILSRLRPDPAMKEVVRNAVAACRGQ